jgi:hypothetical protein
MHSHPCIGKKTGVILMNDESIVSRLRIGVCAYVRIRGLVSARVVVLDRAGGFLGIVMLPACPWLPTSIVLSFTEGRRRRGAG